MSLRVDHRPGFTLADSEYRAWESVFPEDAGLRRLNYLAAAGLRVDDLDSDVRRSLMLITEVEVLTRLYSVRLPASRRDELDAVAVAVRLARSLAHRRGRGREAQSLHMANFANNLLSSSTDADNALLTGWNSALTRLACGDLSEWSETDICITASHTPTRMMFDVLVSEKAVDCSWAQAMYSGTALDWIARDLRLLFQPKGASTQHVGPISDLLYEHDRDQAASQGDVAKRYVIVRSAKVMDSFAEKLHPHLESSEQSVPEIIKTHFAPPFELAVSLVSSLSYRNFV